MNLGLALVGSLLFLAPGLAFIVYRHVNGPSLVRRPLDSSGSVGVLVLAPVVSAVTHGLAFLIFGIIELFVSKGIHFLKTDFSLDPYPAYAAILSGTIDLNTEGARLTIGWALIFIALLCGATIGAKKAYDSRPFKPTDRNKRETLLSELLRLADADDSLVLVGAVTTKTPPFEGMEGWIGPLDVVNLAANDEFLSIRLMRPSVFSINPDFRTGEGAPPYDEFDSPFNTEVIHLEASEISRIEYFVVQPITASADLTLDPITIKSTAEENLPEHPNEQDEF